jgi:hypothetical protein
MDEIDLAHVLDQGDGPAATPEVLRGIVARHHRRRARKYQVIASTAVVVALAGVGIGLNVQHPAAKTTTALGDRAPAGLTWVVKSSTPTPAMAVLPSSSSRLQPGAYGLFGPESSGSVASSSNASSTFGDNVAGGAPTACKSGSCTVYYQGAAPRQLFERHVDGLTITASFVLYAYPVSPAAISPAAPPTTSTEGGATTSHTNTTSVPAAISPRTAVPAVITCPPPGELLVKVTGDGVNDTLFVPAGATTDHPFSVVASAATTGAGRSIVLAVARTSQSVASVTASFSGGGSDAMAPIGGWVVLAQRLDAGAVPDQSGAITLVARSSAAHVLETARLPETGALATAPAIALCHVVIDPNPVKVASPPGSVTGPGSAAGGSPGSSGTSSGSGSSSSGSSTSGTAIPSP